MRAHAACVHACTWPLTRRSEGHACLLGGYFCVAFSIFAGINVIFDESLGISTELRTAYAVFIILSLVAAVVAFAFRISAAHIVHQVRDVPAHGAMAPKGRDRRPKGGPM